MTILPFGLLSQIEVTQVELLNETNQNGYIDPAENISLSLTLKNNSTTDFHNLLILENQTNYMVEFDSVSNVQGNLNAGDSMMITAHYTTDSLLQPWHLSTSLLMLDSINNDSAILNFDIPVEFHFDCEELELVSVNVYADSAYPAIEVLFENNSSWDLQYPGLLFTTNDPYVQFNIYYQ